MSLQMVKYDLPPKWDGVPVTWQGWSHARTSLIYHAPAHALACDQCGAVDESLFNPGIRPPAEGETVEDEVWRTLPSGKRYRRTMRVPAHPVVDLHAFRCRHCGHDHVHDTRTDEWYDLDETDYGPEGSVDGERLF